MHWTGLKSRGLSVKDCEGYEPFYLLLPWESRVYHRETTPFSSKTLLVKCPSYHDWFLGKI